MGYLDSINNPISITTGDGRKYSSEEGKKGPLNYGLKILQQSMSQEITYNLGEFNFINIPGKLVVQTVSLGRVFPLEIYFDGPDHYQIVENFRISCNDKRPWTIEHPVYGLLLVKSTSLSFYNSAISHTRVTGVMIETIGDLPTGTGKLPIDQVVLLKDIYVEDAVLTLTETPTAADINQLNSDNKYTFNKAYPVIPRGFPGTYENYNNAYNTATSYITTATTTPLLMMRSVMQVVLLPAQFQIEVKQRLKVLIDVFNNLRQAVFGSVAVSSKQLFQNKAGACIAAICETVATPLPTDYKNSDTVIGIIGEVVSARNGYYEDLDTLQTETGGTTQSFVADSQAISSLNALVNTTLTALYQIALNSKSRRSLVLEKDAAIIPLCHRVYGLDANDNNLNDLIESNNFHVNEYLIIEKDREIIYYV